MYHPGRGYSALRRGRISIPLATYFLTICTDKDRVGAHHTACIETIRATILALGADGSIAHRMAVVMPDHMHWLFRLGERLTFSRVLARFKAKTKGALAVQSLKWQENAFEHHLRPGENVWPILHYMFMNPYRAGLAQPDERWPGFIFGEEDWEWFQDHVKDGLPYPEWLP